MSADNKPKPELHGGADAIDKAAAELVPAALALAALMQCVCDSIRERDDGFDALPQQMDVRIANVMGPINAIRKAQGIPPMPWPPVHSRGPTH